MAEKLSPVDFMHKFMKLLSQDYQEQRNKLDLTLQAMTTGIEGKSVLHNANELKNAIKADISSILQNGTAKDFLKQKCNIDLDNEDTGSLLGFDCSGRDILNDADVVKEEGEIKNHPSSAVINGCTLTFTSYSDTKRKFVMNGLYTWWIPLAFDKIKEGYGLEYTEDSFVRQMPISLYDKPSQNGLIEGAYVSTTYLIATGVATEQTLNINMNDSAYGTIIIGDKSGATEVKNFGSLDRTLLHELTHALMGANIQWFSDLPLWFKEGGTAVLLEGADDVRQTHILNAISNTAIIDNGFSDSPTNTNEYSVGFLAMRYLLANYTDRQQKIIFESNPLEPFEIMWQKNAHGIKSEFCVSRDTDLNKIMNEFSAFVQRNDYNEVQPWDLVRDNNMGKTFRIPMKDYTETEEDIVADFSASADLYYNYNVKSDNSVVLSTASYTEYERFRGTMPNFFHYNYLSDSSPIDEVINYYNSNNTINGHEIRHIVIYLVDCDVSIFTKNDYDKLIAAVKNKQTDSSDISPSLYICQFCSVPKENYSRLSSMDDSEFISYFSPSNDSLELVKYLKNSLRVYYYDYRSYELDYFRELIKENSSFFGNKTLAMSWNFTRKSQNSYFLNEYYTDRDGILRTGLGDFNTGSNLTYLWHNVIVRTCNYSDKAKRSVSSPVVNLLNCAILTNYAYIYSDSKDIDSQFFDGKDTSYYINSGKCKRDANGKLVVPFLEIQPMPASLWGQGVNYFSAYDNSNNIVFLDNLTGYDYSYYDTLVNRMSDKVFFQFNYATRATDISSAIDSVISIFESNTSLDTILLVIQAPFDDNPIFGGKIDESCIERLYEAVSSREGSKVVISLIPSATYAISGLRRHGSSWNVQDVLLNSSNEFHYKYTTDYFNHFIFSSDLIYIDSNKFNRFLYDTSYNLSASYGSNICDFRKTYNFSLPKSFQTFNCFRHTLSSDNIGGGAEFFEEFVDSYRNHFSQASVVGEFEISETENKKFPCFYLSTGVFKPKDWVNEGLKYPEQVINGENQNDEYIPFNVHVLYDKNMRFDLQGQGTAKRTTGAKGNAYILDGVEGNPDTGYYPVESDAIPGIGCPMIVRSQENKITYPYIECYFTKTSYSGTVTLIFYSADNEAQNPVFQSVAFGLGKSEESSYKYPLYTAGGSCGLYPYGYTFTWTDTGRPPSTHHIYIGGQKINFDMSKGESLSSLLYPCGIEKSNVSNVRIMQPDGRWVSAKNFMQTQESMNGTCGSMLTKSDIESSTIPMIYPTISDIDNVDRFTFTQPVMVIRKRVDEEDESGFTLAFDGIKAKADRLRAIFTAKDGHEYLSVPNGWYSRTFGIPYTSGAAESGENILDVIARLNKNMPKQNYVLTIDLG